MPMRRGERDYSEFDVAKHPMHLCKHISRRIACAAFVAVVSLACHAQTALTPAQALDYRSIADLHFSPDGSKLVYVVYSWFRRMESSGV
jgi:hypothetical protein